MLKSKCAIIIIILIQSYIVKLKLLLNIKYALNRNPVKLGLNLVYLCKLYIKHCFIINYSLKLNGNVKLYSNLVKLSLNQV